MIERVVGLDARAAAWPPDQDDLPAGILSFADDGTVLSANPTLLRMTGHDEGRMPGRLAELLTVAARLAFQTGVWPVLVDRHVVEESYLALRGADGRPVPVVANFRRRFAPGGHPANVAVLMRIRDRQHLDEELLRARRAAEQVPGVLGQLLWRPGQVGTVPYASDALHALVGLKPSEVRDSARVLLHRIDRRDRRALMRSLADAGQALVGWRQRFRVVLRGAERWIEGRASPQALGDGGVLWHAYLYDVTEEHAREVLQRERDVAERASRAKSDFLARVSHELRTPLNAVLGFVQLLAGDPTLQLDARQRGHLERIGAAGRDLLDLVSDVLDLSRIEAGVMPVELRACAVGPVLQHCLDLLEEPARRQGISVSMEPLPEALQVQADARRLQQCLLNLLGNAVKYGHPGGWVRLSTVRGLAGELRLSVQDNGGGMTAEQQRHLFEPFNRLGAERGLTEGSGLGLVITRALVEQMGGRLEVSSEPGVGSRLTIVLPEALPVAAADAPAPPADGAAAAAPPPRPDVVGRPILYVDDHPVNVLLMQALCERRPAVRLVVASGGAEALALAGAEPPGLLLIDIGLPDIDGLTLLGHLRALPALADVPAAAVSADAMKADVDRALAAGFDAYWTKPLDVQRTLAALDHWAATGHLPG